MEGLKVFPLKQEQDQDAYFATLPLSLNILLEVVARALGKKNKKYSDWEGKSKFASDIICRKS